MQLHLPDIVKTMLSRPEAKPASVERASDDKITAPALALFEAAREQLEIMVAIMDKHHIPRNSFVLSFDLEDLTGADRSKLPPEDIELYNAARFELESTIYGTGIPSTVSQRALDIFENRYLRQS